MKSFERVVLAHFSSAFIMNRLLSKLTQLSVPSSICHLIINFLTDRQQLVRLGTFSSNTHTMSTGAPQGYVLSPLLFSLYTNDCSCLQTTPDSSASSRTLKMTVDFRRNTPTLSPLTIMNSTRKQWSHSGSGL